MAVKANCECCMNYFYDEEYGCYTCRMDLDEDEMRQFIADSFRDCPYFHFGDEYTIVKKQN